MLEFLRRLLVILKISFGWKGKDTFNVKCMKSLI